VAASASATSGSERRAVDAGPPPATDGGRPWLVPVLGLLAVVAAVGLRVVHGVRRASVS